jgi:KUP system potassium uptake protein
MHSAATTAEHPHVTPAAAPPSRPGPSAEATVRHGHGHAIDKSRLAALCVTALGVVYGDIGTSPLYALRECFKGEHGVAVNSGNVLGVLSLIFWALVVVVCLKYHVYVLRADNQARVGSWRCWRSSGADPRARSGLLTAMGLFGAALLYGDGIITPAISVLSAVEGVDVATPVLSRFVVPITIGILIGLFLFQKRGTGGIGSVFGPVMLLWFSTLLVMGLPGSSARRRCWPPSTPGMR